MARKYRTATAFRMAIEERLQALARERGVPLQTLRLKYVIERLLARLFAEPTRDWLLKGGFAMELRYRPRARTTKDVDLSAGATVTGGDWVALSERLHAQLQDAAEPDLGDFLQFRIGTGLRELAGAPLGGARYLCEALLAGKVYARFHVDVGVGDAVTGEPERLQGEDLLAFAGIPPAAVLAISRPQQFAEKIHAYTFPWADRTNTRTKDLVDLVLFIETGLDDVARIAAALEATFSTRNTHAIPPSLSPPPEAWRGDFATLATEARLSTCDLLQGFAILDRFWNERGLGKDDA
jgi:predicted nucleotidyltransferase component of viral defense system